VAIARALAGTPSVILADEPTAALDAENGRAVMALLSEVAKDPNRAVLAVTQDHRTLVYADRIIKIEDGRIVGEERPGQGQAHEHASGDHAAQRQKVVRDRPLAGRYRIRRHA
jgi:putative ABC transport system ATP-binding protein